MQRDPARSSCRFFVPERDMSNGRKLQVEDGLEGIVDWHMDMEMIDDAIQSHSTLLEQANTI